MTEINYIEALIVQYLNGTITDSDYTILIDWIAESDENQYEFDQIRELWLTSEVTDNLFDSKKAFSVFRDRVEEDAAGCGSDLELTSKRKHTLSFSYYWIAAASVVLILLGGFFGQIISNSLNNLDEQELAFQEVVVPYGARSKVKLPDGSVVTLNAGSTLRVNNNFGKKRRDLWLDGEAYFVVNKSKTEFVVHSGSVEVKALGTEFNVRAYSSEEDVVTTLIQGRVLVDDRLSDLSENEGSSGITLLPNQKLTIKKGSKILEYSDEKRRDEKSGKEKNPDRNISPVQNEIVKQDRIDPLPDISWKDNEWVIYRENLFDLSVKMERRFDIKIVFEKDILKDFRYTGTLPDESLEQVLKVITIVSPIDYKVEGKVVTFLEKNRMKNK